jgi:hypothetical protein
VPRLKTSKHNRIILVSPKNQILLLHRVKTSSSFPSAHVFPGGNLSAKQDGSIPSVDSPLRHVDSEVYRRGAIRECFEECGILLAKSRRNRDRLLEVDDAKREQARRDVYANKVNFGEWIEEQGGELDTGKFSIVQIETDCLHSIANLLPFTRWITPSNIPKRFTTQMYIYFLPLSQEPKPQLDQPGPQTPLSNTAEALIPTPTPDGGIEHTAARFEYASTWLSLANSKVYPRPKHLSTQKDIILFPPQFFLLHLLSPFLAASSSEPFSNTYLAKQRENVLSFLQTSDPAWGEKCISPVIKGSNGDGRVMMTIDSPGFSELEKQGRRGDLERIILADFAREGPRKVEVIWKKDLSSNTKDKAHTKGML